MDDVLDVGHDNDEEFDPSDEQMTHPQDDMSFMLDYNGGYDYT